VSKFISRSFSLAVSFFQLCASSGWSVGPGLSVLEGRVERLRTELARQNSIYESGEAPDLLDVEYDRLREVLGILEEQGTASDAEEVSPGQNVAYKQGHLSPMLSLRKAKTAEEVEAYFVRLKQTNLFLKEPSFIIETKLDGVAINLVYEDGVFVRASSRGDGRVGVDWTKRALVVGGFPIHLKTHSDEASPAGPMEIRGEVYVGLKQLAEANWRREEAQKEGWSGARHYVAGTLQQEDLQILSESGLKIAVFALGSCSSGGMPRTRSEFRELLTEWGFDVPEALIVGEVNGLSEGIERLWETVQASDNPLDGLVIKLNSFDDWEKVGQSREGPVGAMAWKPRGPVGVAKVSLIDWQVSRFGLLIPAAVLEPLNLAGRRITRIHLHNRSVQSSLGLVAGSVVEVELAGDAIPIISRVLDKESNEEVADGPSECPVCGSSLLWSEPHLRCSSENCVGRAAARVLWFVRKMRIDELGEGRLRALGEAGLLKEPKDLYALHENAEEVARLLGEEISGRVLASIYGSRARGTSTWIEAMGIEGIGAAGAEKIADALPRLKEVESFIKGESVVTDAANTGLDRAVLNRLRGHGASPAFLAELTLFAELQEEALTETSR
jgi:DNA ligase (NAD+)